MMTEKNRSILIKVVSMLLCISMILGSGGLAEALRGFAAETENEADKYSASIIWRKDDNSGNAEDPYYIHETQSKLEYIYMGINIKNANNQALMPGEFILNISSLANLKRNGVLTIVEDDPVFSENWMIVAEGIDRNSYMLVNKKPINKQVLTTLHWEINSRDAVALEENENDELVEFMRTIEASYEINRYKRDPEGQRLDENDNIIDDDGYLRDSAGRYARIGSDGVLLGIIPEDDSDPMYGYLFDGRYYRTEEGARLYYDDETDTYYEVDQEGHRKTDTNGNPITGVPATGSAQAGIPVLEFDGEPVDTNSLIFRYFSEHDELNIDVTGKPVTALQAEDLNNRYSWYNFNVRVDQEKKARGIHDSDLFIALDIPAGMNPADITVLDSSGRTVELTTQIIDGVERLGFYEYKNRKWDINSYSRDYRVGVLRTKIDSENEENNILRFTGITRTVFNDENTPEYKSATARTIYENTGEVTDVTVVEIPDYGDQFYDASKITFAKSNDKYENKNHTDPGDNNSKKLLSGNLFNGQIIPFKLKVSVLKKAEPRPAPRGFITVAERVREAVNAAVSAGDTQIPDSVKYDLVIGDDTLGICLKSGGEPRVLDKDEYKFTDVIIPAGIFHASDGEGFSEGDGYEFVLYVSNDGGESYTPTVTGRTMKDAAQTVRINGDAFRLVIKDMDKVVNEKTFTANVKFTLDHDKEENQLLLRSDSVFEDSDVRVVNYGYMQMIYEKDGHLYDLAAEDTPYSNSVNGDSVIEDTVNGRTNDLERGAYLRRSYSNVFLRTDVTSLSSRTEYTSPLARNKHWDDHSKSSMDRWYGTVTTEGSLISDNPGTLRKFTLTANIPQYVELRDPTLASLRDTIQFRGVDFGTMVEYDSSILTSENTAFSLHENPDGSRTIEIDFDFSGNPLLASELTSVKFSYDVYVEDDNPYIDKERPFRVESATKLKDTGRKVVVAAGWNNGTMRGSDTVVSHADSYIGTTDISLTTELDKRVLTEFSNGLYLRSSSVRGSTEDRPSEYIYRLSFNVFGSDDGAVNEIVLTDKIEDFRENSDENSGKNSKWQGELNYVDIGEAVDKLNLPANAKVYYTTDHNAYFTPKSMSTNQASDMTAHLASESSWKLMDSEDGRIWTVPSGETEPVYAVAAVLLTRDDPKVPMESMSGGYVFRSAIYLNMSAPEVDDDKINCMALNRFSAMTGVEAFGDSISEDYSYIESNSTYLTLLNTLKIKKVDYEHRTKGLSGAKFEFLTFRDHMSPEEYHFAPEEFSMDEIVPVRYNVYDEETNKYYKKTLDSVEVDPRGVAELNLPPGFYFIRETDPPKGYDGDCALYYLIYFNDKGEAQLKNTYDIRDDGEGGQKLSLFTSDSELVTDNEGIYGIINVRNRANTVGAAEFTKLDQDTGLPLAGAGFRLYKYDDSGELQTVNVTYNSSQNRYVCDEEGSDVITADEDGKFLISELEVGTYMLEEIIIPLGYTAPTGMTEFQVRLGNIDTNGMVDLTDEGQLNDVSNIFNSQIRSELRLVKHDENESDQEKNLAGARYILYQLKELSEVEGFSTYDELLEAAKSEIYGWDGKSTLSYWTKTEKTLITDASGVGTVGDVPFGTYFLYEELPPTGYKRNNNRNGYISSDPSISEGIITITAESAAAHANAADKDFSMTHNDVRKKGKAQIQKLSSADGSPLSGARFALLRKLGDEQNPPPLSNYEELANKEDYDTVIYHSGSYDFVTDSDGWTQVIDNLEWGTYYFKEISAPTGYELNDTSREFRVSAKTSSSVNRVFMDNDPRSGSVVLDKYEKDHEEKKLAGAKFGLVQKLSDGTAKRCSVVRDGSVYRIADSSTSGAVTELITDSSGQINVTGLVWGTYEFIETEPPRGYASTIVESFTVDRESCSQQIYRKCEEPRAMANILIDKLLPEGTDYSDAFGTPTFIYKITEINNLTDRTPLANGMSYTEFMSFSAGDTAGHTAVSVAQGCYMIEEISVSRYEFSRLATVTDDTNISSYYPAAGTVQTDSRKAYCDLRDAPEGEIPQYRAEYRNSIERFDGLSHITAVNNRFPAANRYITGIRAVYDGYVPVSGAASSTYRIPLDDIAVSRTDSKDETEILDTEQKSSLTYTGSDGYSVNIVEDGGSYYLEVPNTKDYSLLSRTVTVTDGSGMTAELLIRYEGAKSDIKKYVTLRQDSNNLSVFGDDETSADVVFTKSADTGEITSDMDQHLLHILDSGYVFKCWQYEDENGQLTEQTFNNEQEIKDFIFSSENEGNTVFTFVAQLENHPDPTAKIINTTNTGETSFIQNLNWVAHTTGNDRYLRFRSFQHVDYDEGMAMWQRCLKNPDSTKVRYEINDLYDHEIAGNIHKAAIISVTRNPNNPEDPEYPDVVYLYAVNRTDTQADGYDVYWFSKSPRVLIDGSCKDLFYHGNKFVNLTDVSGVEDIDFSGVTTMERAFINCPALTSVTINSDFDNCITALSMFSGCTSLTDVTINGDFPRCESFKTMFSGDTSLKNVTFNSNLEHIHIFNQMFANCTSLESVVNLKDTTLRPYSSTSDDSFTYANNYNQSFKEMFLNCSSLTNIDFLKGADMTECGSVTNMFNGCTSLSNQAIIDVIKTWTFSTDTPILLPDSVNGGTDNNAGNMGKAGFPAGWYECANGRVYIESGGRFRKNSFEPSP